MCAHGLNVMFFAFHERKCQDQNQIQNQEIHQEIHQEIQEIQKKFNPQIKT